MARSNVLRRPPISRHGQTFPFQIDPPCHVESALNFFPIDQTQGIIDSAAVFENGGFARKQVSSA